MKNDEQCNLCLPRSQEPSNRAKAWVGILWSPDVTSTPGAKIPTTAPLPTSWVDAPRLRVERPHWHARHTNVFQMNIPRCIRTLAKPLELVIQTGKLGKLNFRMLWWIKACYLAICIIPSAVKAAKAAATSTAAAELATPAASTTGDVCKQSQTCANGCQWIKA